MLAFSCMSVLLLPLGKDISENWKCPHLHVTNPFPNGCSPLHIAMSTSSALFLYLMILLKLVFLVGDTCTLESCHPQVHIGKCRCSQ